MTTSADSESVEQFRARARTWLRENMPLAGARTVMANDGDDTEEWLRARELQGRLYAGGFAGICYPRQYGGLGLGQDYQQAFNEESADYEMPSLLNTPSLSICGPTILDMGTEEQKTQILPKVLSGELVLCQFLSEPSGGSNLAGLLTRAERSGEEWVINGSKIWSTSAYAADYALCLTRTNWDKPKHQGLTMFLVKVHQPKVELRRIEMVNGSKEFCQEFFDDLVVPDSARVGAVDDGWTVARTQLFYERQSMGGASPYVSGPPTGARSSFRPSTSLAELAAASGVEQSEWARDLLGGVTAMNEVARQLVGYVGDQVQRGRLSPEAVSVLRLFHAETAWAEYDAGLDLAGPSAVAQAPGEPGGAWGQYYLSRQGAAIGGGTTEMARNTIAERVLKMPREPAPDKDAPFRDVKQGR